MINQSIRNGAEPYLILDAGALLFNRTALPTSQLEPKKEQAEGIIQAMRKMRYSAIGLSPFDLTAGAEFVKQLQDTYGVPFVSANLVDKKTGRKIFRPYITIAVDNLTVTIIGLTATAGTHANNQQDYTTLPWQQALSETLGDISGKVDIIILLSSFSVQQNRQIAGLFEQIDIILQSGTSTANLQPLNVHNTLITQTASRGKYIGRMDINWLPTGQWPEDSKGIMQQLNDTLRGINREIKGLEKKSSPAILESNRHYQNLLRERSRITEEIKAPHSYPEELISGEQSNFSNSFISLRKSIPQDPEVKNILSKAKESAFNENKKRLASLRHETARKSLLASLAGSETCKECHPWQYQKWQKTGHAMAWKTLEAEKQQFNDDCLICHVTLPTYNRKKVEETDLLTALPKPFQSVGCESCHGPGRLHLTAPERNKPLRPTEKTCRICHTIEQDDNFDFARKRKLLQCNSQKESEG